MPGTRTAWVLQEVAAARAGLGPAPAAAGALRADPVAWAYVLRDAVALAEPDVVVAFWDPALEADALAAGLAAGEDWVDRVLDGEPIAGTAPAAAGVELVRTLCGLPGLAGRVAARVSAPRDVAAALGPALLAAGHDADAVADADELTDLVADALGGLVTAYAEAGAALVLLVGAGSDAETQPLTRAAQHARVPLLHVGTAEAVVLPATAWALDDAAFAAALATADAAAAPGALLLSDGPVPADVPAARLRAARPPG